MPITIGRKSKQKKLHEQTDATITQRLENAIKGKQTNQEIIKKIHQNFYDDKLTETQIKLYLEFTGLNAEDILNDSEILLQPGTKTKLKKIIDAENKIIDAELLRESTTILKTKPLRENEIMNFLSMFKDPNNAAELLQDTSIPEQTRNNLQKILNQMKTAPKAKASGGGLVAPRTFSLRVDDGRVMYSNVFTRKCSERRTFMRGGTALDLYVEPGASFRGHHWRTMLKTMYADKLPAKFDLYQGGKVDMAALVDGNVHGNMTINKL